MWSQWPWVSSTRRTPSALAQLEQLLVLVGGVEQHGVAGLPAAQRRTRCCRTGRPRPCGPRRRRRRSAASWRSLASRPTCCHRRAAGRRLERPSGRDDVEAEAEGDGDLAPVERHEARRGRGSRSAAARWMASTSAQRLARGRASAARSRQRWSTGTTWRRSQSRRTASSQVARAARARRSGGRSGRQRLGEGQRRRAPDRVGGHAPSSTTAAPGTSRCRATQRAGVEGEGHGQPRSSPRSRSRRTPAQTGDRRSGRRPVVGGGRRRRGPRAIRSSSVGCAAAGSSGPSWATGRPSTVIDDALAAARPAARPRPRWPRSSRMPTRSIVARCTHVYTRVHRRLAGVPAAEQTRRP